MWGDFKYGKKLFDFLRLRLREFDLYLIEEKWSEEGVGFWCPHIRDKRNFLGIQRGNIVARICPDDTLEIKDKSYEEILGRLMSEFNKIGAEIV